MQNTIRAILHTSQGQTTNAYQHAFKIYNSYFEKYSNSLKNIPILSNTVSIVPYIQFVSPFSESNNNELTQDVKQSSSTRLQYDSCSSLSPLSLKRKDFNDMIQRQKKSSDIRESLRIFVSYWCKDVQQYSRWSKPWIREMIYLCIMFAITGSSASILVKYILLHFNIQASLFHGEWYYRALYFVVMYPTYRYGKNKQIKINK